MDPNNDFRNLLHPLDDPRLTPVRQFNARQFGATVEDIPIFSDLLADWRGRLAKPFHGLTCDGNCQHGLFRLGEEGAPTGAMVAAAKALLETLDGGQRERLRYDIQAEEWRVWSNPEFLVHDRGLRLEDLDDAPRRAVLDLIQASLSAQGYKKARDGMRMNAFLGELTALPEIMNEWSYNVLLFGEPSSTEPWGWNLYGHHLVLNCFVQGGQMVISPTFMGAEPNVIDVGPYAGTTLFRTEETVGLELMRALAPETRERATIYKALNDPAMPEGRWHPADQRHLGGAFSDNRIVPYEGVRVSNFGSKDRDRVVAIAAAFLEYLPPEPLAHRMRHIEAHLDETWWSWIGGHGEDDPFYYRIQSPVVMLEFDHHSGVWLNNAEPAKCHIHTVVRTPNGNDYGKDLLRQHYANIHPCKAPGQD